MAVRWYRNRRRCLLIYGGAAVGPLSLACLIIGKSRPVWTVLGALAILAAIWLIAGAALAGFGVTRDALIVRSPLGTQHRVPWSDVAAFEVVQPGPRYESSVVVVCADGRRLHTGGCTFRAGNDGHSRAEAMADSLKTDRLARSDASDKNATPALPRRTGLRSPGRITPGHAHSTHAAASIVFGVLTLSAGLFFLVATIGELGPALRASHDQGVRGSFVAVTQSCGRGGCSWYGNFVLPDGTVTLRNVAFNAGTASMSAGQSVPALDSGYSTVVFPVNDSTQWVGEVVGIAISAFFVVVGLFMTVVLTRRARRMGVFHRSLLSAAG